jgi:hypothetical protein
MSDLSNIPTALQANIPILNTPIIDQSGRLNPAWYGFFRSLQIRTGGTAGSSSGDLQAQIDALTIEVEGAYTELAFAEQGQAIQTASVDIFEPFAALDANDERSILLKSLMMQPPSVDSAVMQAIENAVVATAIPFVLVSSGASYSAIGSSVIWVNKTVASPTAIVLPSTPTQGMQISVKDRKGDASTNPITVNGNGKNIDGASTFLMNFNHQSATLYYGDTEWGQM